MFDSLRSRLIREDERLCASFRNYFGYGIGCPVDESGSFPEDCIQEKCGKDNCTWQTACQTNDFNENKNISLGKSVLV